MGWRDWTGVGERRWTTAPNQQVQPSKTLWDLLQLLIVPVILVAVSLWWSASQDTRDKSRADQVRQDTTLNDYFQQMSDLMLNKQLLSSNEGDAVRSVARTVTLTTLRRLDSERKAEVLLFLQEAGLIEREDEGGAVVELDGADLRRADVTGADLTRASLTNADLTDAVLAEANLTRANLIEADLMRADLTRANLRGADLTRAYLAGADLTGANLTGANLTGADLTDAKGLRTRNP